MSDRLTDADLDNWYRNARNNWIPARLLRSLIAEVRASRASPPTQAGAPVHYFDRRAADALAAALDYLDGRGPQRPRRALVAPSAPTAETPRCEWMDARCAADGVECVLGPTEARGCRFLGGTDVAIPPRRAPSSPPSAPRCATCGDTGYVTTDPAEPNPECQSCDFWERKARDLRAPPSAPREDPSAPFHAHLDACERCREHPFDLCPTGARLLVDAGERIAGLAAPPSVPNGGES